jgi:hypothetical protein
VTYSRDDRHLVEFRLRPSSCRGFMIGHVNSQVIHTKLHNSTNVITEEPSPLWLPTTLNSHSFPRETGLEASKMVNLSLY